MGGRFLLTGETNFHRPWHLRRVSVCGTLRGRTRDTSGSAKLQRCCQGKNQKRGRNMQRCGRRYEGDSLGGHTRGHTGDKGIVRRYARATGALGCTVANWRRRCGRTQHQGRIAMTSKSGGHRVRKNGG